MRAYILVTGFVFLLLVISHVARVVAEGGRMISEPIFIATTILSVALFAWAAILFRRTGRTGD
ncbi:MAG: hypothetical protein ABIU09_12260 [Pyrinomonadaceae bacterium]